MGGKKVEWNFVKFLIDENGEVVECFLFKMKLVDFEDKVEVFVVKVNN